MLRRAVLMAGRSTLLAVLSLTLGATSAMASSDAGTPVGSNIGNLLTTLAQDLLLPIAGLAGLAAFLRRDVGHAVTIFVIAAIVGVFVYGGTDAVSLLKGIANEITMGK